MESTKISEKRENKAIRGEVFETPAVTDTSLAFGRGPIPSDHLEGRDSSAFLRRQRAVRGLAHVDLGVEPERLLIPFLDSLGE